MTSNIIDWNKSITDCLRSKDRRHDAYQPDVFTASSVSGCVRQCVRNRLGLGTINDTTLRHFYLGTMLHRFMQTEVALGHLGQSAEFEKQIAFEVDGIKFKGHIDCVTDSEIIDFKSTANIKSTMSFPVQKSYLYQLAIYKEGLLILEFAKHPYRETSILYIDKRNLDVARVPVLTPDFTEVVSFCKQVMQAEKVYAQTRTLPPKCNECFSCTNERD